MLQSHLFCGSLIFTQQLYINPSFLDYFLFHNKEIERDLFDNYGDNNDLHGFVYSYDFLRNLYQWRFVSRTSTSCQEDTFFCGCSRNCLLRHLFQRCLFEITQPLDPRFVCFFFFLILFHRFLFKISIG